MRKIDLVVLTIAALAACRGGEALIPSKVNTSIFDGEYTLNADASFKKLRSRLEGEPDPKQRAREEAVLAIFVSQYANFRIKHGVIRSGTRVVQEFSLFDAKIENATLRSKAVWHEDVADPGDSSDVEVQLRLVGDVLELSMLGETGEPDDVILFTRRR